MAPEVQKRGNGRHALFAAGQTGGHVFPLLAVAEELTERHWKVSFAGRESSIEEGLVRGRGFDFHPVRAEPLVGRGPLGRLRTLVGLPAAIQDGRRLMGRVRPDVVLGSGGYVSAPTAIAARTTDVPMVLLELNTSAGVANRWLSRWASVAALAQESARARIRCPTRAVGVPVRREFFAACPELPESTAPRLLVLGGTHGSTRLNEAMPRALELLASSIPGIRVLHQAGEQQLKRTAAGYAAAAHAAFEVTTVGFLAGVAHAMAESHLVVSTAGASTTAELCAVGRAGLLLPLAAAGAHQVANARVLSEAGAAQMMLPSEVTLRALAAALSQLLPDPDRLAEMGRRAARLARPQAAADVADLVASSARPYEARSRWSHRLEGR